MDAGFTNIDPTEDTERQTSVAAIVPQTSFTNIDPTEDTERELFPSLRLCCWPGFTNIDPTEDTESCF